MKIAEQIVKSNSPVVVVCGYNMDIDEGGLTLTERIAELLFESNQKLYSYNPALEISISDDDPTSTLRSIDASCVSIAGASAMLAEDNTTLCITLTTIPSGNEKTSFVYRVGEIVESMGSGSKLILIMLSTDMNLLEPIRSLCETFEFPKLKTENIEAFVLSEFPDLKEQFKVQMMSLLIGSKTLREVKHRLKPFFCADPSKYAEILASLMPPSLSNMKPNEFVKRLTKLDKIKGQEHAVECLRKSLISDYELGKKTHPNIFIAIGSSGAGKSYSAQIIADILEAESLVCSVSTDFSDTTGTASILGAAPGFVGHDNPSRLDSFLSANPDKSKVIVFNEFDKASDEARATFFDIFYEIADSGRIIDKRGVELNFANSTIILTGNIAEDLPTRYPNASYEELEALAHNELLCYFQKINRPSVSGRLNSIYFSKLSTNALLDVAHNKLKEIIQNSSKLWQKLSLSVDASYEQYLIEKIHANLNEVSVKNARFIIEAVTKDMESLASILFEYHLNTGNRNLGMLTLTAENGAVKFIY